MKWVNPYASGARAYLAGGYTGVPRSRIPSDRTAGRLVAYADGAFRTLCTTDEVLWWVSGVESPAGLTVYASGETGRVLRLRGDRCETLTVDGDFPFGRPTLWGSWAAGENDVWFVGGAEGASGREGVILRYDGASFRRVTGLPEGSAAQSFFKIAPYESAPGVIDGAYVVGANGVVLRWERATDRWSRVAVAGLRATDNRLFTVSCAPGAPTCWAVGGAGAGLVARGAGEAWETPALTSDELAPLNGVWARDASSAFLVGNGGAVYFASASGLAQARVARTRGSLHAVHGRGALVFSVGGELTSTQGTQSATIMVRGAGVERFTFDGQAYEPAGSERALPER